MGLLDSTKTTLKKIQQDMLAFAQQPSMLFIPKGVTFDLLTTEEKVKATVAGIGAIGGLGLAALGALSGFILPNPLTPVLGMVGAGAILTGFSSAMGTVELSGAKRRLGLNIEQKPYFDNKETQKLALSLQDKIKLQKLTIEKEKSFSGKATHIPTNRPRNPHYTGRS